MSVPKYAGTEVKCAVPLVGDVMVISKFCPSMVDTSAVMVVLSVSSVCRVITRRDLSPPNRLEASEVHGEGAAPEEIAVSRRTT